MGLGNLDAHLGLSFTHGQGIWLHDQKGRIYLDATSGMAECSLGYAHPDVTRALQKQASLLLHDSTHHRCLEQEQLEQRFAQMTPMQHAFFCHSGAEANEIAIKFARLFGHKKGIDTPSIMVMSGAFHGGTLATLSASGSRKMQAGHEPLVTGFVRAPYNDMDALRTIADHRDDVVAVMIELIQSEAGVVAANSDYLRAVATLCTERDWLFMVDEVHTATGRTGSLLASQTMDVVPDILTMAKGLANGVPIGVCLLSERVVDRIKPASHDAAWAGNALACATALTVLDVMERDALCEHAVAMGARLKEQCMDAFGDHPHVKSIRGRGLLLGIELDRPARDCQRLGLLHQIILDVTAEKVIRLMPPLIIQAHEVDALVLRLKQTLNAFVGA